MFDIDFTLDEDIFAPSELFLGAWRKDELINLMDEFGILDSIKKMGFNNFEVDVDTKDPFVHRILVTDKSLEHNLKESSKFLISLWVRRKTYLENSFKKTLKESNDQEILKLEKEMLFKHSTTIECSMIEYLILQNPRIQFNHSDLIQLPSQNYPGLHVGKQFNSMLIKAAKTKHRDCLMNVPEHFHNAYFYHSIGYRFISPAYEGYFHCIVKDCMTEIEEKGLAAVSWAIYGGSLVHGEEKVRWKPEEQVMPISDSLNNYFHSKEYKNLVEHYQKLYQEKGTFSLNWETSQGEYALSFKSDFKRPIRQLFGSPVVFKKQK